MEWSLHRALKERHAEALGGRCEVVVGSFRIDAQAADGSLVEIQSSPLSQIRSKLTCLLDDHAITVVKPVVLTRRVVRVDRRSGQQLSVRRSPWRGTLVDIFDELVGIARVLSHPNLRLEIVGVDIDEIRSDRRRRPGYTVLDRTLSDVLESRRVDQPDDLWSLLPGDLESPFTTRDIAQMLGESESFAQRVAYCLRHAGASRVLGKTGNRLIYERVESLPSISEAVSRSSRCRPSSLNPVR